MEAGLIAARFVHYLSVTLLFGVALFPLYAFRRDGAATFSGGRVLMASALLAIGSGLAWFIFVTASMAGGMAALSDTAVLTSMLRETDFGKLWIGRIALAVVIAHLAIRPSRFGAGRVLLAILAAALLGSLAATGHTQVEEGVAKWVHAGADLAHLLAAGFWIGGLLSLLILLSARRNPTPADELVRVLHRFSGVGYVAVASLLASGLINSWFLVGSIDRLTTLYGLVLAAKLAAFLAMGMLALSNRFWIIPKLAEATPGTLEVLARLRRHVFWEQGLGVLVLGVVSLLGTMQPPTAI